MLQRRGGVAKISPDFEEEEHMVSWQDVFPTKSKNIQLDDYFVEGRVFYGDGDVQCVYINNNIIESNDGNGKYSTIAKKHTGYSIAGADFWRVDPNGETIRQYINNKEKYE